MIKEWVENVSSSPAPDLFFMGNLKFFILALAVMFLGGCVSLPVEEEILSTEGKMPEPEKFGIYHKVSKGETLWSIAKAYDVAVADIVNSNNIPDVARIEKNQLIFIPGANSVKHVSIEMQEKENNFVWPVKGELPE